MPVKFYIHEPLLLDSSPVFRAMLSQPRQTGNETLTTWTEAQSKEVRLPEDRVEDWVMLTKWLYSASSGRSTISAKDIEKLESTDLLQHVQKEQPGLSDAAIESAVAQYITWHKHRSVERNCETIDLSKPPLPFDQCHSWSDISKASLHSKVKEKVTAGISASEVEQEFECKIIGLPGMERDAGAVRPDPPALGSMIRLYILADKYGVDEITKGTNSGRLQVPQHSDGADPTSLGDTEESALRQQIILRLRTINKLAKVVPDREDIERLWSNLISRHDPLKTEIVDMYARMNKRSFRKIFGHEKSGGEAATSGESDCDVSSLTWSSGVEENREWHPGFLRQLLVRREDTK